MLRRESGLIRLLPLLLIAILLIGVVGYVSVKKIEDSPKSTVLSDSAETRTESEKTGTDASGISESELETEKQNLEDVGDLEVDIPQLSPEIEAENRVVEKGVLNKVESAQLETSEAGKPRVVRVKGTRSLKLLGMVPISAPVTLDVNSVTGEEIATVSEPLFFKLLGFLFTK